MEDIKVGIKGNRRIFKHQRCSTLRKISKCRGVRLSLVLFYAALVCFALRIHDHCWNSPLYDAVASMLQADITKEVVDCGAHQLSPEEIYKEHLTKHTNLKIKLLSEQDGAPSLQSKLPPRAREITIVTQATMDRWPQLEKLATSWGGALCVVVYVKTRAEIVAARNRLMWLHNRIEAQARCRLHLQMATEEGFMSESDALSASYPVNALRNAALGLAKTELVFLLDADFEPSPRLHEKLTANEEVYSDLLARSSNRGQLLVIPAFQAQPDVPPGVHPGTVIQVEEPIPQTMQELRERWKNGSITFFHWYHGASHDATSYSHFLHPLTKEPYHVQYKERYEPYFIAARELIPKFDERFRGYGKNKIAHAYNCAAQGFSFVVLPGVYVWEVPHAKSEFYLKFKEDKADRCHVQIMEVVYKVFRDELQSKVTTQLFPSPSLSRSQRLVYCKQRKRRVKYSSIESHGSPSLQTSTPENNGKK